MGVDGLVIEGDRCIIIVVVVILVVGLFIEGDLNIVINVVSIITLIFEFDCFLVISCLFEAIYFTYNLAMYIRTRQRRTYKCSYSLKQY